MGRIQNVKKITIFGFVKYFIQLVLKFILQSVIIKYMGDNYVGVNGLFSNVFSLLNLAELGIGSAIVFSMYKPIAENDIEKVKALNNLYKKFYIYIAVIVSIIGVAITPFLPYVVTQQGIEVNIYIIYLMFLFNMVIGYLSAHKRSLLFAYQKNDVELKIKSLVLIITTILQIICIVLFKNYYVHASIMIFGTILDCIVVQVSANKLYPQINGKSEALDDATKKEITKNVKATFLHKIGSALVVSTDNILILNFGAVAYFAIYDAWDLLGYYSNYILICDSLILFFSLIINGLKASVGNYIAEKSTQQVYEYYKKLNFVFSWLIGFCAICLICLFQPFIYLWRVDIASSSGILLPDVTVLLIVISFFLTRMRSNTNMFKDCAGLMWNDRWKPIAECVVNLVASILLAKFIGLDGIILGTIISTLVAPFWVEPVVLHKYYFKVSSKSYFLSYFIFVVVTALTGGLCYYLCSLLPFYGIGWFIIKCFICAILPNLIFLLVFCKTKIFRETINLAKSILFSKKSSVKSKKKEVETINSIKENIEKDNIVEVNSTESIEDVNLE